MQKGEVSTEKEIKSSQDIPTYLDQEAIPKLGKGKNEVLILEDGKLWAMSCSWHEGQSYGRLEAWMPGYVFDWSKFKPLCTLISRPLK